MVVYKTIKNGFNKHMSHPQDISEYEATIGIVMPCYNLGNFIHEAIDSIFTQTFTNFKLIIVDDASTDKTTRKILEKLSLPKNASVVFEKKNLGLSGVRNKYMEKFKTKYVFSFDPDDILQPQFLEKSVEYLETHPKKAAVATWLDRFGIESGITKFSEKTATLPDMLVTNNYLGSCLLRKEVFEKIGGYDTAKVVYGAEDYDFWISVLEQKWELGVIPEPLFRYRRLNTSSSFNSALPERAIAWRKYIVQKHKASYETYMTDIIAAFEKRASESHAGYIDMRERHDHILEDYTILHTYVEDELLPKMRQQDVYLKSSVHAFFHKVKNKLKN
jgi:glycosyltransferase involved in cell wall biosynthesis